MELKQALLTRVGLSLRELEIELFSSSKKFYKHRVERARQVVTLAERVSMLCPRWEDLKLFLAKGLFARDLPPFEAGILNSAGVTSLAKLVDVDCLLKGNGRERDRDRSKSSSWSSTSRPQMYFARSPPSRYDGISLTTSLGLNKKPGCLSTTTKCQF